MKRHSDFVVQETKLNMFHSYEVYYNFDMSKMVMTRCDNDGLKYTAEYSLIILSGILCYEPSWNSSYITLGEMFQQQFREYIDSVFEEVMELNV